MPIRYTYKEIKRTDLRKTIRILMSDGTTCKRTRIKFLLAENPAPFIEANLVTLFADATEVSANKCIDLNTDAPPPANLHALINQASETTRKITYEIYLSDGVTARRAEMSIGHKRDPQPILSQRKNELWRSGDPLPMQTYQAALQRAHEPMLNALITNIYDVINTQAEPDPELIIQAARNALSATPKMTEWQKLTTMLQGMSQDQFREFIALIITITLSKSARG